MGCSSVSRTSPPAGSGEPSSNSGAGWLASSTIAARLMAVVDLVGRGYIPDSSGWWYQRTEYGGLATGRMVEKLATPAGRTAYAERKWLSEAPNGWIKHVLGFRRFSLRGLAKVRCEWDLVCLALNVKRLQPLMAA